MIRRSIGKKILLMVLAVALAGLGVSMVLSISNMMTIRNITVSYSETLGQTTAEKGEEALIAQVKRNLQDLVERKSSDNADVILEHYLEDAKQCAAYVNWLYRKNGTGISDDTGERRLLDQMSPVMEPVFDENPDMVGRIYLASEQGFMFSYDGKTELIDASEYDFRKSQWYQEALTRQEPLFSEAYYDALGKGLMTTCSAPCYNAAGDYVGAVCIDICLEDFYQEILNVDVSENTAAALVDTKGNLIAGPKVDFNTADYRTVWGLDTAADHEDLIQDILAGGTGVGEANGMYFAYAPIHALNWRLIIRVPRADIISPVTQMSQDIQTETQEVKEQIERNISSVMISLLAVAAVTVCAMICAAVRFTARIVEPLKSLQRQVEVIGQGNLDVCVQVASEDEIGVLAREFNVMAVSLKGQMDEIQKVTAEKERIGAELSVAAQIQASMLPSIFPAFTEYPEFDIYASMDPAKEVGGDFYDFFLVDEDHLAVVMADVSGKGVPSALFMVIAKTLIKDLAQMGLSPDEVFRQANEKLCESNDEGMFVTAWLGVLDIHSGHMVYVNAGHNPPLICRQNGAFEYLKQRPGFILAGMEGIRYQCGEINFGEQDMLYLYTDGVTEATNAQEELYGEDRLEKALNRCMKQYGNQHPNQGLTDQKKMDQGPKLLLDAVKKDIRDFVKEAPQSDDITMLGLKILKIRERRKQ